MDALEIGGVASHLTRSLGRISRSRYDLRVVNLGAPTRLSAQLRRMTVTVSDLNITGPLAFPRRVLALRRLVRATSVDLIHSYGHAGRSRVKPSTDPRRRADLGAAAAARAQAMDVAVWAPRLEELYASVIRSATAA